MSERLRALSLPQPDGLWAELGRVAHRRSCERRGEWDQALQGVKNQGVQRWGDKAAGIREVEGVGVSLLREAAPCAA